MRISDWSSDVCSSDLLIAERVRAEGAHRVLRIGVDIGALGHVEPQALAFCFESAARGTAAAGARLEIRVVPGRAYCFDRSEEHTSELQSLKRISYAVFCLQKKNNKHHNTTYTSTLSPCIHSSS